MFKITLENTWNKNGIPTNYIKYLKVNTIQDFLYSEITSNL